MAIEQERKTESIKTVTNNLECERGAGHESRGEMNFWQNVVMTLKVLSGFALIGSALWGLELWISVR